MAFLLHKQRTTLYQLLEKNHFNTNGYKIVSLREEDIFEINKWRNEQLDILRQKNYQSDKDQKKYFYNIIKPSFSQDNPSLILFSFLYLEKCIGYGGLTNIDWKSKRTELSFIVSTDRYKKQSLYKYDLEIFLTFMKEVAFQCLKLNRIYTETYDIRSLHMKVLEKNGFVLEGRLQQHVLINGKYIDSLIHGCLNNLTQQYSDYN